MARTPRKNPQAPTVVLPRALVTGIVSGDLTTGRGTNLPLADASTSYFNQSIANVRKAGDVYAAVRALARVSGDVSTAIAAYVRLANTSLRFEAYDSTHQLSADGATLLKSLCANFDNLGDYSFGFDNRQPIQSVTETLLREVMLTGATALELVLDKARMPFMLKPVSPSALRWKISDAATGKDTNKLIPWQLVLGHTIILDIPTFFYASLDQDPTVVYPKPPIEAAINTSIFQAEVIEDIRRVVRRSGHSRLVLSLVTDALLKAAPIDIKADSVKLQAWLDKVRADLSSDLSNLNPESALVLFDTVQAEYLNSEIGASADYGPLMELVDGTASTALRCPPSVLGKRMGGSQNVSSTESLLFIKQAAGIQAPVASVLSRAFTLAARLAGFDGYVKVKFDSIDLRPDNELAAFKAMSQAIILEQLSLGFLTDQEAADLLGTGLRAPGAPALSGTFFYKPNATATQLDPSTVATGGDPVKRAASGNAPTKAGGQSQ